MMVYRIEFMERPHNGSLIYLVVDSKTLRRKWYVVWVN